MSSYENDIDLDALDIQILYVTVKEIRVFKYQTTQLTGNQTTSITAHVTQMSFLSRFIKNMRS